MLWISIRKFVTTVLNRIGFAVVATTVILLAGFAVVLLSDIPPIRSFGILTCVGIIAALVADLIFLPVLLRLTHASPRD